MRISDQIDTIKTDATAFEESVEKLIHMRSDDDDKTNSDLNWSDLKVYY